MDMFRTLITQSIRVTLGDPQTGANIETTMVTTNNSQNNSNTALASVPDAELMTSDDDQSSSNVKDSSDDSISTSLELSSSSSSAAGSSSDDDDVRSSMESFDESFGELRTQIDSLGNQINSIQELISNYRVETASSRRRLGPNLGSAAGGSGANSTNNPAAASASRDGAGPHVRISSIIRMYNPLRDAGRGRARSGPASINPFSRAAANHRHHHHPLPPGTRIPSKYTKKGSQKSFFHKYMKNYMNVNGETIKNKASIHPPTAGGRRSSRH